MKVSLRLANGATLEFEGDATEFGQIQRFLDDPPDSLATDAAVGADEPRASAPREIGNGEQPPANEHLSPAAVAERLAQIGPTTDQERVTIIAQMAIEAGKEGIDYDTLTGLYRELGLKMPAQFPAKTFANAKASGLVAKVKNGVWRPTYRGTNYGRGFGRDERGPRRPLSSQPSLIPPEGGESD